MSSTGSASTKKTDAPATWSGGLALAPDRLLPAPKPQAEAPPNLAVAARAGLLVMTGLLSLGLGLGLAFRPPSEPAAEIDLRVATPSPKLNTVQAVPTANQRVVAAAPTAPAAPKVVRKAAPPVAPVSHVELPRLIDAEPAPMNPAFLDELLAARALHRGDSSMIRNWKLLGLPAFLAVALAADAAPAAAQFDGVLLATKSEPAPQATPSNSDTPTQADQLRKLQTSIDDLKTSIRNNDEDLKALRDSLAAIRKDITDLRDGRVRTDLNVTKTQSELNDIKNQITELQRDVDELRRRPATPPASSAVAPSNSVSGYAAIPGLTPPPAGLPTGRIRLLNSYFVPETVRINDRTFLLQPGQEQMIEGVPAGAFTYEVLGVTDPRTRALTPNEMFTINVHPRG